MHSKLQIWDFLGKNKTSIDAQVLSLRSFYIDDPYAEKIIKDRLYQNQIDFRFYTGDEITKAFLEEQFLNLSFFTDAQHFIVLNAENISLDAMNFLFSGEINIHDRQVVLFFSKFPKNISDIVKSSQFDFYEIESPKPWDGSRILQFCLKEMQLNASIPVQQFILENLDHSFENFLWVLELIKLNFEDKVVDVNQLKLLIQKERYDFFELLEIYHSQKLNFYKILIEKSDDFDWIRQNATSMQNHIVKLLNPEEIRTKAKLTKYDQNLLRWSESGIRSEFQADLKFFMKIEIESKSKNVFLREIIRIQK